MALGQLGLLGTGFGTLGLLGGASAPFVPLLDAITNLYGVYATKRLLTSYTGPIFNLRRDSDATTLDFSAGTDGWPSKSAINTWLAGATAFVTKIYDQSGNTRDISPASTAAQPTLNLLGAHPVIEFNGSTQEIECVTQLAAFAQNQGGCSIVAVRKHGVTATTDRMVAFVSTATAAATRMGMGATSATLNSPLGGRRVDADAINRTAGFVNDANWGTEIGRWDWTNALLKHQLDAQSETKNPFSTAGSSQNTASTRVMVGSALASNFFAGQLSMIAFVQRALSDAEVTALI